MSNAPLDDVVFVLALEGGDVDPKMGVAAQLLDAVVTGCQPAPGISHIELLFSSPGDANRDVPQDMHFATYLGQTAGFGRSFGGQREFYLGHNFPNWRAVPIVAPRASPLVRAECLSHVGTPYSISRYLFSAPPLRSIASIFDDRPQRPAHCATLTARCLRRALGLPLKRPSAWYSPSTLFLEISQRKDALFAGDGAGGTVGTDGTGGTDSDPGVVLHRSDEELRALDPARIDAVVRRLASRALTPDLDDITKRIVQKQLAAVLLRCSVVRCL